MILRNVAALLGSALAAVVAYVAWLGWNAEKTVQPGSTSETGPYEAWQVVGLALTWVVVVAVATWVANSWVAVAGGTAGLVGAWVADITTHPTADAGLWPIGAVLIVLGAGFVGALVALITVAVRSRVRKTRRTGR